MDEMKSFIAEEMKDFQAGAEEARYDLDYDPEHARHQADLVQRGESISSVPSYDAGYAWQVAEVTGR